MSLPSGRTQLWAVGSQWFFSITPAAAGPAVAAAIPRAPAITRAMPQILRNMIFPFFDSAWTAMIVFVPHTCDGPA